MTTVAMSQISKTLTRHDAHSKAKTERGLVAASRAAVGLLRRRTPKDRGLAQASWKWRRGAKGSGVVALVENSSPIIGILEKGARPHRVSLEGAWSIYEWIERHFVLAGGTVVSGRDMTAGTKFNRLTARGSRAHKLASARSEWFTKRGKMLADWLQSKYLMPSGVVPQAANIAAAIIDKIRLKGQKPKYFVRDALPILAEMARGEVERELRQPSRERGGKAK
jgi:hypothetical protein